MAVWGVEDISSSEREQSPGVSEEESHFSKDEYSSSPLYSFVPSPSPDREYLDIRASGSLLREDSSSGTRHQNPLEPEVVVQQKGGLSPRSPASSAQSTKRGQERRRKAPAHELSDSPVSSPSWPPSRPSDLDNISSKLDKIIALLDNLDQRVTNPQTLSSLKDGKNSGMECLWERNPGL